MERYLQAFLRDDMGSKILLISGPRQCGKTTLALSLSDDYVYLNWDDSEHRSAIIDRSWNKKPRLVIFDEIHKMPRWKSWIKGLYDTHKDQSYVVTGSARLDTFRKVGDSLAGRYFSYHLHPIDVKEGAKEGGLAAADVLHRIFKFSGFPEPFLKNNPRFYRRWAGSHMDIILRQDLIDLETVSNIQALNVLVALLQRCVGSPVSIHSLARDLQVADKTIRRWLGLLEELYVIFKVSPYHRNIARSLIKASKYYFYDVARVESGDGARFENLVACALRKEIDFRKDCYGDPYQLCYLRDRDGHEVDFALTLKQKPVMLVEAKLADADPAESFRYFAPALREAHCIQLVKELAESRTYKSGLEVQPAVEWLAALQLDPDKQ